MEKDIKYGKEGVKLFIFSTFTRDRETCATLVKLLDASNLKEQAQKLNEYNTSLGPKKLGYEVELNVAKRPYPFNSLSGAVTLSEKPRGKCIIINNVEDPQVPPYDDHGQIMTSIGLKRETERFKHIFNELYFDVQVLTKLSAIEMKKRLLQISRDESLKKDQAFVLIVLSHGEDESVLGYNACEALRRINFQEIDANNQEAKEVIKNDKVPIKDLVAIFTGNGDQDYLNSKPKLHFYICCRSKCENKTGIHIILNLNLIKINYYFIFEDISNKPEVEIKLTEPNKEYVDTFVSYACAEGNLLYDY